MRFRLFQYPLPAPEELTELNTFLASHRVVHVQHQIVSKGAGSGMLVFVVEYLERSTNPPQQKSEIRVDYREELSPAEFEVFSKLRDFRRRIAEEEAVPVYNIFTNAQLAEVVRRKITTASGLRDIEGVGKSRVEKYGERLLAELQSISPAKNPGEVAGKEGA